MSKTTTPIPDPAKTPEAKNLDVAHLSYEAAREELVQVVGKLENGSIPLEDALSMWERGQALAQHCQSFLDQAQARLEAVAPNE